MARVLLTTEFRIQEYTKGAFYIQRKRVGLQLVLNYFFGDSDPWYDVSVHYRTYGEAYEQLVIYLENTIGYPKYSTVKTAQEILNAKS